MLFGAQTHFQDICLTVFIAHFVPFQCVLHNQHKHKDSFLLPFGVSYLMLKNGPHEAAVEIVFCAVTLFAGQVYKVEMACLFFPDGAAAVTDCRGKALLQETQCRNNGTFDTFPSSSM